jgi:hypothetical protein
MRKLFLIIVLCLVTISFNAQIDHPTSKETNDKKQEKAGTKYCCPKCDYCAIKKGKCPDHNCDLVKEGKHCCKDCKPNGDKAGKCKKCGKCKKEKEDSEKQK